MTINIYKLNEQNDILKKELRNYDFVIFDTVSTIKNTSFYWNDGYTQSFFAKIDKELQFTSEIINTLYHVLSVLMHIAMAYNNINEKKAAILGYSSAIINLSDFDISVDDEEDTVRKKRYLYNKVVETEDEITAILAKIDVPYIKKIDFQNLDIETPNEGFVGMLSGIDNEIEKIKISVKNAKESSNMLKENLYSISNIYNSTNCKKLVTIIEKIDIELQTLNYNLEMAADYIQNRKETYTKIVEDLANKAENLGNDF